MLTFDDAATAASAASTASSPRSSLGRVDRLPLCTTSRVSPGHDEASVLHQDDVDALANILPVLSLEDDTASVIQLGIQRQSFESNIVDPTLIPTTKLQDNQEPQHTDDVPLDDLETIYEDYKEADEACFALEEPVDVFTCDGEEEDIAASLPERPHYNNLFELISSSNLSDSDNTEPTDDNLLSLVEPMEKLLPIPEIQIDGIPLCLLDDAWSTSTSTIP
ncbi:hypothetical protein ACQY0O_008168 [Thecaphora frezii]